MDYSDQFVRDSNPEKKRMRPLVEYKFQTLDASFLLKSAWVSNEDGFIGNQPPDIIVKNIRGSMEKP